MKKRVLSILLSVSIIFTMSGLTALAEDTDSIGEETEEDTEIEEYGVPEETADTDESISDDENNIVSSTNNADNSSAKTEIEDSSKTESDTPYENEASDMTNQTESTNTDEETTASEFYDDDGGLKGEAIDPNRPKPLSSSSGSTTAVKYSVTYYQTDARTMLDMVNDFRTGNDAWYWNKDNTTKTTVTDLDKLTYDYDLEQAAMERAAEIAISFSHTKPNGQDYSYTKVNGVYPVVGENIACGYKSIKAAFEGFCEANANYDGQGHRRIMLSYYKTMGVGCVKYNGYYYVVQEFSTGTFNTTSTSANNSSKTVSVDVLNSDVTNASLSASPGSYTLKIGSSSSLPVLSGSVTMTNTSYGLSCKLSSIDTTWSSSSTGIASISGSKVKGVKAGSTSLKALALGKSKSVTVTVEKKNQSMSAKAGKTTLAKGKTTTITASGTGTITYSTSNKNIATVSSKGKVTAKSPGKATITVKAGGNSTYKSASKKITITVTPKSTSLKSIKNSKGKKMTVKWKKGSGITGYQIQYSTNKSFKSGNKSATVKGASKTSKTLSKLKKGKTYYVRVRTYKTVSGTKYYSSWSSAKKVKIKK